MFLCGVYYRKDSKRERFYKYNLSRRNRSCFEKFNFKFRVFRKRPKLAYVCGDQITLDLEKELVAEGFRVKKKIINYSSSKIDIINEKNIELIKKIPPDIIFVYSMRSAESFISIINNFSLAPMMTQSHVMCISKKINDYFFKIWLEKSWNF